MHDDPDSTLYLIAIRPRHVRALSICVREAPIVNNLKERCAAYLNTGPPLHMTGYVPETLCRWQSPMSARYPSPPN